MWQDNDYNVKKFFYPILAEKKSGVIERINEEICKLSAQKDRLKKAYTSGILEMEDFAEDYKLIENKLATLENEKINSLELNQESFNPQHLMAERDIEREILTDGKIYKDVLLKLWNMKEKDEKQALISKFIDTAVLRKNSDGMFAIEKINFRSSFIEQIDKLLKQGVIDIPNLVERDGEKSEVRLSFNMNDKQLEDYLDKMKQELDIEYLDLGEYKVEGEKVDVTYDNKSEVAKLKDRVIEFKLKSNQRMIRAVALKVNQNFMAKPTIKYRLGMVTRKTAKK